MRSGKHASILFFVTGKRTRELADLALVETRSTSSVRSATDSTARARRVTSRSSPAASASPRSGCRARELLRRGAHVRLFYGAQNGRAARRRRALRRGRLRADPDDRRRNARRARIHYRRVRNVRVDRKRSTRAAPRRCCDASDTSRRVLACARSLRWKRRSPAASVDVGDASCRLQLQSAQAPSFPAGGIGRQRCRIRAHLQGGSRSSGRTSCDGKRTAESERRSSVGSNWPIRR